MLNDLWPEDIQAEEVLSPMDILESQAALLADKTNGLLMGIVESHDGEDRRILAFEVLAQILDSKVRLFEVHLSKDFDYPAAFILPNLNLPDFLQKEKYVPSASAAEVVRSLKGQWVENEWVATSPQEFSERTAQVLDHPSIKGRVLSLISRSQAAIRQKKTNGKQTPEGRHENATDEGE